MAEHPQYNVLIIGAGSTGAVLASRLSEDARRQVLLIEAGPDYRGVDAPPEMRSANPLAIMDPTRFPDFTWPRLLVKRTPNQALRLYDRGRGLGGSSAINWQVAHRAMLEDYDIWAEQGCQGWSGEELLPAMNRLENDLDFGDAPYHGKGGPVTISRPPVANWGKVDLALLEAGLERGHPWHDDLNAPESTGISATPLNRTAENRVSTNDAYLEPARHRENLTIVGNAHVDFIHLDGYRATGVRAIKDGKPLDFFADEVIVSAGSTFSPPILMRSGIGPDSHLRELAINTVADLPVGQNLVDHASVGLQLELKDAAWCASIDERHSNCYIRYSSGLAGADTNDMVFASRNVNGYNLDGMRRGSLGVLLWQTFSRGELKLPNREPFSMPVIDQHLLSDPRDLMRLRVGVHQLFDLARSRAVQSVTEQIVLAEGVTGATNQRIDDLRDDRDIDEWMLRSVRDTWHLVGTCRMGDPNDPRTVVDPHCRVLGFENLRVIDGSIMPEVPRANTNLTCMTIGEHMAERMARVSRQAARI